MVPLQVLLHRETAGLSVLDCVVMREFSRGELTYDAGEPFTMALRHDCAIGTGEFSCRLDDWASRSSIIEAATLELEGDTFLVLIGSDDHLCLQVDPSCGAL